MFKFRSKIKSMTVRGHKQSIEQRAANCRNDPELIVALTRSRFSTTAQFKQLQVANVTRHADIVSLILSMDSGKDLEAVREKLAGHGEDALPAMVECLPRLRTWRARDAIVSTAIKFARTSDESRKLGFVGLADKSRKVRQTACSLAAFSLDHEFLPTLSALRSAADRETAEDALAAIDAIQHRNHHLFMDRRHSGRVTWNVMGSGIES